MTEQEDLNDLLEYPNNFPKYIPRRDSFLYKFDKLDKINLTNTVAYEMLIRTKEYKELIAVDINKRDELWNNQMQELGLNPKFVKNLNDNFLFLNLPKRKEFDIDIYNCRLKDIEHGLEKCIKYYVENKKIYKRKKDRGIRYKYLKKVSVKQVLTHIQDYYIPTLCPKDVFYVKDILMTNISDELAIVHLAKDFQKKVSDSCNEMQNIKIFTNSIRPLIRLKESSIVNLDLNLDLPIKELELYIQTLKNEFYNKKIVITKYENSILHDYNKSTGEKKKNQFNQIINMFYCFDYYESRVNYINEKNKIIEIQNNENSMLQEKIKEKEKIERTVEHTKAELESIKKEILEDLKPLEKIPVLNKKGKTYIFNEKHFEYSKINSNTALGYYNKISPFIRKLEYKDLILGKRTF